MIAKLNRREAMRYVSALLGGVAFTGGADLLAALESAGAAGSNTAGDFTAEQIALLDEIADTILPATDTPGAKAAKVGAFMALMVTDCYGPEEQTVFRDGMQRLDAAMREQAQVSFMHPSGTSIESEDTLKFSALTGVRPMIETVPLEQAAEAYAKMMSGAARFRMVLVM